MADLSALAQLFAFLGWGRYNSTPPTIADGSPSELQVSQQGRLLVSSKPDQTTKTVSAWMGNTSGAMKTTPGNLWTIQGASGAASGTTKYFQLFDITGALTSGSSVPKISIPVGGGFNFSETFGPNEGVSGLPFTNGMQWAVSSTQFVYTTDATNFSVLAIFE